MGEVIGIVATNRRGIKDGEVVNFYKRFPGDYLRDTVDLSMLEDGAYTRMLDWCYSNERPIAKDKVYLIARAGTPAERRAVDAVLARFFEFVEVGYVQSRTAATIKRHIDRTAINTDIGRRGGRPTTEYETDSVSETQTETKPNTNPSHSGFSHQPQAIKKQRTTPKPPVAPLPSWLDAELWQHWREARAAMGAPMTTHGEALLLAKLERMLANGADYVAVVEQSIERNWKGFFAVEERKNGHQGSGKESRIAEQERVLAGLTGGKPGRIIDAGH